MKINLSKSEEQETMSLKDTEFIQLPRCLVCGVRGCESRKKNNQRSLVSSQNTLHINLSKSEEQDTMSLKDTEFI